MNSDELKPRRDGLNTSTATLTTQNQNYYYHYLTRAYSITQTNCLNALMSCADFNALK